MKKSYSCIAVLMLSMLCWLSPGWVFAKAYTLRHASTTQPNVTVTKVEQTNTRTLIELQYQTADGDKKVGVYPPGHDLAFYITDLKKSKKYALRQAKNVAFIPNETLIKEGETHTFTLIFPKTQLKVFHLIEGSGQMVGGVPWHFSNVRLR